MLEVVKKTGKSNLLNVFQWEVYLQKVMLLDISEKCFLSFRQFILCRCKFFRTKIED